MGRYTGEDDVEYGVLLMFYCASILPPPLAQTLGLSDIENQVVDMQFSINRGNQEHYQAVPLSLAGTTGLVEYSIHPFRAVIGKNEMVSSDNEEMFPLHVRAHGWDRGKGTPVEMEMDFVFSSGKGILIQGNEGILSMGGTGTPYYSIPNLVLDASASRLRLDGKDISLREGQFWFDHQWGVLGTMRVEVFRAVSNLAPAAPGGWDWFELQFEGDRQIAVLAMHNHDNLPFYGQEGPNPPGTMSVKVGCKFMDENKKTFTGSGTLNVTDWLKSDATPDPNQYWGTNTWHPNRWEFHFDAPVPEDIRNIILVPLTPKGSFLFFSNGEQYQEAPVHILNSEGTRIGHGFAESVEYANTSKNRLALAGQPQTPEMLQLLDTPAPTRLSKIWSAVYTLTHQEELNARGGTSLELEQIPIPFRVRDLRDLRGFRKPRRSVPKPTWNLL